MREEMGGVMSGERDGVEGWKGCAGGRVKGNVEGEGEEEGMYS